jgi:hypothetical protein
MGCIRHRLPSSLPEKLPYALVVMFRLELTGTFGGQRWISGGDGLVHLVVHLQVCLPHADFAEQACQLLLIGAEAMAQIIYRDPFQKAGIGRWRGLLGIPALTN